MLMIQFVPTEALSAYEELVLDTEQVAQYLQEKGFERKVLEELNQGRAAVEKFITSGPKEKVKDIALLCRDAIIQDRSVPEELYHIMSNFSQEAELDRQESIRLLVEGLRYHAESPVLFCEIGLNYFHETIKAMKEKDVPALIDAGQQAIRYLHVSMSIDCTYKTAQVVAILQAATAMVMKARQPNIEGNA